MAEKEIPETVDVDKYKVPANPFEEAEPAPLPEKNHNGICSCSIVEKYKKPMGFMIVILLLIYNTIMVFVGIVQCYSSPCPIEPIIPIYLIGAGIVGIASRIILIIKYYRNIQNVILNRTLYGLLAAEFIFLIIASTWIFGNFEKKQYSCNGAAFTWAFLILIFYYIIILSPLFIPCGIESYHCCFKHKTSVAP